MKGFVCHAKQLRDYFRQWPALSLAVRKQEGKTGKKNWSLDDY